MSLSLATPSTVRIGDVGAIKCDGTFHKYFNICEQSQLPPYFRPPEFAVRSEDLCTYVAFEAHSFITSRCIDRCKEQDVGTTVRFKTAASQGTILALPTGGIRTELREITPFFKFIANNVENWAKFQRDADETEDLRLITGHLCASHWGIASFANNTDPDLTLQFSPQGPGAANRYMWQAPPSVNTAISGKIHCSRPSDALGIIAFTITPRASVQRRAIAGEEFGLADANPHGAEAGAECPQRTPCEYINDRLLALTKMKVAVSHDRDWCAVLERSDNTFPDGPTLAQRVLVLNDAFFDAGIAYPHRKATRVKEVKSTALLDDIDSLRDHLNTIGKRDPLERVEILHSITTKILAFLHISKSKDPLDFEFLLTIATLNVTEEVEIVSELKGDCASSLHLYASTMWARYQVSGDLQYLDSSIQFWQKSLKLDPRRTNTMSDLASALWSRYGWRRQPGDLKEVMCICRGLILTELPNSPSYSNWLNTLGLALWDRYRRKKQINDMDQAISCFRQASLSYSDPCEVGVLSNLGNILMAKARSFKDTTESDEAIWCYRRALVSVSTSYKHRSALLSNIGDALSYRYDMHGRIADLDESVGFCKKALDLPKPHHRDRVTQLIVLSGRLLKRFEHTQDTKDLEDAFESLSEAKRLGTGSHSQFTAIAGMFDMIHRERDAIRTSDHLSPNAASPSPTIVVPPTILPQSEDNYRPVTRASVRNKRPVVDVRPDRTPPHSDSGETYAVARRSRARKPYKTTP